MISLDTLNVLLDISESELVEELMIALLTSPPLVLFFEQFPAMKRALLYDVSRRKTGIVAQIKNTMAPPTLAQEFSLFQQVQTCSHSAFAQQLDNLLIRLNELQSPFASQAQTLVSHADKPHLSQAQHTLFLQRWRHSLTLQTLTFNQQLLAQEREKLLAELQQRQTMLNQLAPVLADNDTAAGRLWDMGRASLHDGDYQLMVQYSDFLARQPELTKLAEQLGRSRGAPSTPTEDAPPESIRQQIREPDSVPEEVNGIHQSDDILRLLPAELATLGISELELEFYRRLVERQLLTYRLQGDVSHDKVKLRPPHQRQQQDDQPQGPFIVGVDTSGSMGGFNERCAKALCLALLKVALIDKRRCYIMLFAHDVIGYELTGDDGMAQAIRFLSQRFRGGTNLSACVAAILKRMEDTSCQHADAVIISDFIAQRLPDALINAVQQRQTQQQQRFHAVAMSSHGKPGVLRIFDHIWRFDTDLKSRWKRRWQR